MSFFSYLDFLVSLKFWFTLFVVLIVRSVYRTWLLRRRMPPGPTPWPFLGNLLAFSGEKVGTHEIMFKLSKQFGDPMTIFFFTTPTVILTKYEMAKTVLNQTTFSSRPETVVFDLLLEGSQDIAFAKYGPLWQFHRKVTSKSIRSIIDAEKLENKVIEAVDLTVEDMLKHPDNVQPYLHMSHVVSNVIISFCYDETYKIDDPEFISIVDLNDRGNKEFSKIAVVDLLPFGKYLPIKWLAKKAKQVMDEVTDIHMRRIREHRRTFSPGEIRDFCDAILNEQEQAKKDGQADQLDDKHVFLIIADFFSAGTDTTSSGLTWLILYLIIHPNIQEECYRAIKEAIGDRLPRLSDRIKLPFVEACMLEALRLRPPVPLALPHASFQDTTIGDYFVPEGATVLPNIYAMHIDPEYWENPLQFNPRLHFIDEDGHVKKPPSFAPFGFGRRVCLGEQLARNDIFLAAVRLLQLVRLEQIDGVEYNDDYDIQKDFTFSPMPCTIQVSARK